MLVRRSLMSLLLAGAALAAAEPAFAAAPDRARLDQLIAEFEAKVETATPTDLRAAADAALKEAQRIYPANHPAIAARKGAVALAMAQNGEFDAVAQMVEPLMAQLKAAGPAYIDDWRDAVSLRAYVHNYKGEHDAAQTLLEELIANYRAETPVRPSRDYAVTINNLAANRLEQGRLDDALALNAEATDMGLALPEPPLDVMVWQANRVAYLFTSGRTDEAIVSARQSLARSEAVFGPDHPQMGNLLANLGSILFRLGRPREAQAYLRRAFELNERVNGKPNQNSAAMRVMFAQALSQAQDYAGAIRFLDAAIPVIDGELGAQSDRALQARDTLANALARTGKPQEALALAQELVRIRDERLPATHSTRYTARENLAKIALQQGEFAMAAEAVTKALELRRAVLVDSHPDVLLDRALLLRIEGAGALRPREALLTDARGLFAEMVEAANYAVDSAQGARQRPGFVWLAELFAALDAPADLFEAQQWAMLGSVEISARAASAERKAASDPSLAKILAERRALIATRGGLLARLDANVRNPDAALDKAGLESDLRRNAVALSVLEAGLSADQRDALLFRAARLAALQAGLGRQDAALLVTRGEGGYLASAITRDAVQHFAIADGAALDADIAAVRRSLSDGGATPFDAPRARALSDALLPASLKSLLAGRKRLLVGANGQVAALPMAVLSAPGSRGWLADSMEIVRFAGAPRALPEAGMSKTNGRLLALGGVNGKLQAERMAMRSAGNARLIADLPDLAEARAELLELAARSLNGRSSIFTGAEATEAQLRSLSVQSGDVLAFATHGLVSGEIEGVSEPALVLTPDGDDDGLLLPSEIGAMRLPAAWVILSACNTASSASTDAPQLSGLVQSFFMAGAGLVMASHWPVRDDMARRLTSLTLDNAAKGQSPTSALRAAMTAVRRGRDGGEKAEHPALWAPFELFVAD